MNHRLVPITATYQKKIKQDVQQTWVILRKNGKFDIQKIQLWKSFFLKVFQWE